MNCVCNIGSITDSNMKELGTLIFIIVCKYVYFFQNIIQLKKWMKIYMTTV